MNFFYVHSAIEKNIEPYHIYTADEAFMTGTPFCILPVTSLNSQKPLYGTLQTRATYSFLITRGDLLRVAISMMKDYQQQTCVGNYLRDLQAQAIS